MRKFLPLPPCLGLSEPHCQLTGCPIVSLPACLPAWLATGRAQRPGGDGKSRYFIDSSYCQPYDSPDRKWPGGDNGHSIGKRLGLQAGRYDHIWDTSKCYSVKKD